MLVTCTVAGCTNTRNVHPTVARRTLYCAKHAAAVHGVVTKRLRPIIKEAQKMKLQGWSVRDIAEMLGRKHQTVNRWMCVELPVEIEYKVVRADYWKVGIYMDADVLDRDFLKPGCFDPQAVLERDGKRFHVRRMANGSQRLEAV